MSAASGQGETKRVLVVDDDAAIRLLAREILNQEEYLVEEAADGRQAVSAIASSMPDLILLDVMIPEIDGFTVCREVRSHPDGKNTAILMMTGLGDVESIRRAYDAGATDFITKPINWSILGHRIRYMIKAGQAMGDLRKSEALLSSAQRIARLGSWDWNMSTGFFHCSDELYHIFNLDRAAFDGTYRAFVAAIHPEDRENVKNIINEAIAAKQPFRVDHRIMFAKGMERFVSTEAELALDQNGRAIRMTGTVQDITARKQAEDQIRTLALYDSLTGLPNRMLFNDRLEQALRQAARYGTLLAVIFIDLDNFKDVNDGLGHKVGDLLLQEVAQRLLSAMRETDTVARLGGDEFTVFTQNLTSPESIYTVAQKIVDLFSASFLKEKHNLFISVSVGVAIYPTDGKTAEELLKQADTAMYYAKEHGKGRYQLFSKEMQIKADSRLLMHNELRRALEHHEFILHYQPKFASESGELTGIEALIRWQHPERGIIPPESFLPLAESMGLMVPLGEWILLEACRQNMAWMERGYPRVQISVNLSPVQFQRGDILAAIRNALEKTGMEPQLLEIEIRENMLIQSYDSVMECLNTGEKGFFLPELSAPYKKANIVLLALAEIRKMGVSIALDDFGTGYSSLGYLSDSPINVLKIDRRFVQAIKTEAGNEIILAIIALSKKLGMKVIAEGVETDFQKLYLMMQDCQELQGFLVGKPVEAGEFVRHFPETAP